MVSENDNKVDPVEKAGFVFIKDVFYSTFCVALLSRV